MDIVKNRGEEVELEVCEEKGERGKRRERESERERGERERERERTELIEWRTCHFYL